MNISMHNVDAAKRNAKQINELRTASRTHLSLRGGVVHGPLGVCVSPLSLPIACY